MVYPVRWGVRFALLCFAKLGCTSAVQIKKMLFFFVLRSVCTNFASKLEYWFLSVYMHLIATLQISKPHTPIT